MSAKPLVSQYSPEDLDLVGKEHPAAFNVLTRMASRLLKAPVSLVSIVQDQNDRQYFASALGLSEPWASRSETPLSHSICRFVRDANQPLVVRDAREDPLLQEHPAISALDVIAYLGAPVLGPDGDPWGAVCVIDSKPRDWSLDDINLLVEIGKCVSDEITLRAALAEAEALRQKSRRYQARHETLVQAFMVPGLDAVQRFDMLLKSVTRDLGMPSANLMRLQSGRMECIASVGTHAPAERDVEGTLAATVSERVQVLRTGSHTRTTFCGERPRTYVAAPIFAGKSLFGVLEVFSTKEMSLHWSDDDASILTTAAMLISAHLDMIELVRDLRNSELYLAQQVMDLQRGKALASR